ncbi:MAG: hypothetical protein HFH38_12855 [Lachnospiraceae bacterium]|jgi:hypothetical protein|nr:hypothetical protein [Lachnospiraceae bacterium]
MRAADDPGFVNRNLLLLYKKVAGDFLCCNAAKRNSCLPAECICIEEIPVLLRLSESDMGGIGKYGSKDMDNNINISYLDGEGTEQMVRIEMLTRFNIYKQAEKCQELMDLLRENKIRNKFHGEEKEGIKHSDDDVFAQVEKLESLKEKDS